MADLSLPPEVMAQILRGQPQPGTYAPEEGFGLADPMAAQRSATLVLRQGAGPGLQQETDPDLQPQAPPTPENPRKWTPLDLALQGTFAGASMFDAIDSGLLFARDKSKYESNPLLGHHPSMAKLVGGAALGQVASAVAAHYLPKPWRTIAQLAGILAEGSVIASNKGVKPFTKILP